MYNLDQLISSSGQRFAGSFTLFQELISDYQTKLSRVAQ